MYQHPINIYPIIIIISFKMVFLLNRYIYESNIYRVLIQSLFKLNYSLEFNIINK